MFFFFEEIPPNLLPKLAGFFISHIGNSWQYVKITQLLCQMSKSERKNKKQVYIAMDGDSESTATSVDENTENFCENPTRDTLAEGLMGLIKPAVDQLDERIRATRFAKIINTVSLFFNLVLV